MGGTSAIHLMLTPTPCKWNGVGASMKSKDSFVTAMPACKMKLENRVSALMRDAGIVL